MYYMYLINRTRWQSLEMYIFYYLIYHSSFCLYQYLSHVYLTNVVGVSQVELIVMVVECIEKKSIKCTQYWPEPTQTASYGCVDVTCISQADFVSNFPSIFQNLPYFTSLCVPSFYVFQKGLNIYYLGSDFLVQSLKRTIFD